MSYLSSTQDKILITPRAGTPTDPFLEINEQRKIINNVTILTEFPSEYDHVLIDGYIEVFNTPSPASNEFVVNYDNKIVTFNPSENGKTVSAHYKGKGIVQFPASQVYAHSSSSPDAVQNLQEIIDNGQTAIDASTTLNQKVTETNTAIQNAETATNNANDIGARLSVFENYDNSKVYNPLNKVFYDGSTYQCILESTGKLPTNTTYWKLVAQRGDMQKSVYDTNNNGKVDDSDKLGGQLPSYYAVKTEVAVQMSEKASITYVDTKVASVASGSPKGTYATLADLQNTFPSGNTNTYVVIADGNWYYWSGLAWISGGVYQSTGIGDGTVTQKALDTVLQESLVDWTDIVDQSSITNGYINKYDFAFYANENYRTTDYIPLKKDDVVNLTIPKNDANANMATLVVYDSAKVKTTYVSTAFDNQDWVMPNDGFIRASSYLVPGVVKKNIPDTRILLNKIFSVINNKGAYYLGKTMLWLGTSIPAGGYPLLVGDLLGATVVNNAVGTQCARTGTWERVTVDDPMGIKNAHWQMATRSLTQTITEKQSIIDNWATIWGGLSTDPRKLYLAPNTLTTDEQNIILNSSYEYRLTPYLNGTYPMPDLFVLDHGYNDGGWYSTGTGGTEELSFIPFIEGANYNGYSITDDEDRHFFIGAMNKIVRMILEANPKARICMVGHYDKSYRPWVIDAQEKFAGMWGFPLLKLWERTGWSTQTITVGGVEKRMIDVYMPDGVHPSSDSSGVTNQLYAEIVANWLKDVR